MGSLECPVRDHFKTFINQKSDVTTVGDLAGEGDEMSHKEIPL